MKSTIVSAGLFFSPLVLVFWISTSSAAGQVGFAVRDTHLRTTPAATAEVVSQLSKGEKVTLLIRKGGWYQVENTSKQQGWVKMLAVRFQTAANARSTDLSSLANVQHLAGGGVATGVRGMDDEALQDQGSTEVEPLVILQRYSPDETQVRVFASQGGLQRRHVEYVEVEK